MIARSNAIRQSFFMTRWILALKWEEINFYLMTLIKRRTWILITQRAHHLMYKNLWNVSHSLVMRSYEEIDVNSRSNQTLHQGYREPLSTSQHSRSYCTIRRSSKPPDRARVRHPWLSRSLQRSLGPPVSSPSPLHYHWNKKATRWKEREKLCRWERNWWRD